jgi:hypothetical protein
VAGPVIGGLFELAEVLFRLYVVPPRAVTDRRLGNFEQPHSESQLHRKMRLYIPVLLLIEEDIEFESYVYLFSLFLFSASFRVISPPVSTPRPRHHGTAVHVALFAVSPFVS